MDVSVKYMYWKSSKWCK